MDKSLEVIFADSNSPASELLSTIAALPELKDSTIAYSRNEMILREGDLNDRLLVLLEGAARLSKLSDCGESVEVDTFGPGSLLGLTSFWGRTEVFASIHAQSDVVCLSIDRDIFDSLTETHPGFVRVVQNLFVRNLSDRYRNMIRSHVERDRLSVQLEAERNHLRDTLNRLERTTNRLVNQEKLATMGQLLAGIAHEINNPVGSLLRGIESASEGLEEAFKKEGDRALESSLLAEGLACPFWESGEKRERMQRWLEAQPEIGRPMARRLAQLTDAAAKLLEKRVVRIDGMLAHYLSIYELGVCLRAARISAERIEKIVTSLRNYGRQAAAVWEETDIVQGIQDTLTVLNNRLRHYEMRLDFGETRAIPCNLGEINQVWTNLLVNAMDATPEGGELLVKTFMDGEELVVCIEDSGKGIDPAKLQTVFEANYTTKNQSGTFGLGLGLSISREIMEKHGGTLQASNRPEGGARFEARFPVESASAQQ